MTSWYHITTGQFGYPQPVNNFGYIDETYDSSRACLTCHIGLRQKAEFRFKTEPKASHSQFIGLNWVFDQIFVRQQVKDIFEREQLTGIDFSRPVINKTGVPLSGLYQLRVDSLLSDGLVTEDLEFEICELPKKESSLKFLKAINSNQAVGPFCGQMKYNFPVGDNNIKIRTDAFGEPKDFLRLNYYFGSGGSANRPIIISDRVKQIIDRQQWRGAFLKQITLVN